MTWRPYKYYFICHMIIITIQPYLLFRMFWQFCGIILNWRSKPLKMFIELAKSKEAEQYLSVLSKTGLSVVKCSRNKAGV